jgi:HAD superfamily hydrolase (TIGR01484 family)
VKLLVGGKGPNKRAGRASRKAAPKARILTIIADIEGTLTDRSGRRSSEAILHRLGELEASGVSIVLCSGRSVAYQRALREKWGLDPDGPCVAENGCSIFWKDREYMTYDPTTFDRDALVSFLRERGAGDIADFDPDKNHAVTLYPPGFMEGRDYSPADIERIYRFIQKVLKGSSYGLFYTSASCEVLPGGVDKGAGLEPLLNLAGMDPSRALFIGDGQNDIPAARLILRGGGKVGAPANAVPGLKRLATYVAKEECFRGALEVLDRFIPERDNSRRTHRQMP